MGGGLRPVDGLDSIDRLLLFHQWDKRLRTFVGDTGRVCGMFHVSSGCMLSWLDPGSLVNTNQFRS